MNNVDKEYLRIGQYILDKGIKHNDRTGTGTIRVFGVFSKYNLEEGFPILTTKKMPLRLIAEELIWMLSGSTDVKQLQEKKVHIWDGNGSAEECEKFGRMEGDMGPIYGHQWRNFGASKKSSLEIDLLKNNNSFTDKYDTTLRKWINRSYNNDGSDQIKKIVDLLQNNPNSRRIMLNSWNTTESDLVNPPPCHYGFQLSVIDGRIDMLLNQRSADYFLGQPFNISFYSLLIHLFATVCELKVGTLNHCIGDSHIYLDHLDQVKEQLSRKSHPLPALKINERLKGTGFDGLMDFKFSDIILENYVSESPIKGSMSV